MSEREEDPLLRFAYVPSETPKVHAVRFRGHISDLPHHFARFIRGSLIGSSFKVDQVQVITSRDSNRNPLSTVDCSDGDWIVVDQKTDRVEVLKDSEFLEKFQHVSELSCD